MSHVTDVKLRVREKYLDVAAETADQLGLELRRGQETFISYGGSANRCDHALRLKDHKPGDFEIGLVKDGDAFKLLYDPWGAPGARLEKAAGSDLRVFKQEYAVNVAMLVAKKKLRGWTQKREVLATGHVRLTLQRR